MLLAAGHQVFQQNYDNFKEHYKHICPGMVQIPYQMIDYLPLRGHLWSMDNVDLSALNGQLNEETPVCFITPNTAILCANCGSLNTAHQAIAEHICSCDPIGKKKFSIKKKDIDGQALDIVFKPLRAEEIHQINFSIAKYLLASQFYFVKTDDGVYRTLKEEDGSISFSIVPLPSHQIDEVFTLDYDDKPTLEYANNHKSPPPKLKPVQARRAQKMRASIKHTHESVKPMTLYSDSPIPCQPAKVKESRKLADKIRKHQAAFNLAPADKRTHHDAF